MKTVPILSALLLAFAPVAMAQDAGGTYVNIGEYTGDGFVPTVPVETVPLETYDAVPMPVPAPVYETAPVAVVPETYAAPVIYSDPIVYSEPVVYSDTPVYSDVQTMPAPVATLPYQPPLGVATTSFTGAGMADGTYEAARLAAYDANRDGTVTTAEAIATLRPLTGQ